MKLFAIFHLNLMFSSIPEEDRQEVIDRCYWPLLHLIEDHDLPLGIEASAITLEIIMEKDPAWIEKFRTLLNDVKCEFIGSGYGQIIGPLVPSSVNQANLRIGNQVYTDILSITPRIALVNEQAWSAGLVSHYLEAGYKGIFMDYDNPARFADNWDDQIQHFPQRAQGVSGESIPILWSRSMVFQKLQRFVHGELELAEYMDYIENMDTGSGWLPIYGNDAEIFDFRPGRYKTEANPSAESEWDRMAHAFAALRKQKHTFHLPSQVLNDQDHPKAGRTLQLSSAEQPVPVKKQSKYNLTRWAVSGRDDFFINSKCRAIAALLEKAGALSPSTEEKWRELCFCWSSDFRTHITQERFNKVLGRLDTLAQSVGATIEQPHFTVQGVVPEITGRLFKIENERTSVTLNTAKGLTIHKAAFAAHDKVPSFGTLEHGYFKGIDLGADFFSGHLIMEGPGSPKETDLSNVTPRIQETEFYTQVSCSMEIHQGHLEKAVRIHRDKEQIDILYNFSLTSPPQGILRLGHITLLTGTMNANALYFQVANGGEVETFSLKDKIFDHSSNVSFLVSSSQATGMTDSKLVIGEKEKSLTVTSLKPEHAFIALLTCRQATPSPFVRVSFSMKEMDETCMHAVCDDKQFIFSTGFSIKPHLKAGSI